MVEKPVQVVCGSTTMSQYGTAVREKTSEVPITMQSEARNTERSSAKRLQSVSWKTGIPFVSGGDMCLDDLDQEVKIQGINNTQVGVDASQNADTEDGQQPLFFSDTTKFPYIDPQMDTAAILTTPKPDSEHSGTMSEPLGHPDSSDDDQVIFKGRKTAAKVLNSAFAARSFRKEIPIEPPLQSTGVRGRSPRKDSDGSHSVATWTVTPEIKELVPDPQYNSSGTVRARRRLQSQRMTSKDDEEIMTDLAHMNQDEVEFSRSAESGAQVDKYGLVKYDEALNQFVANTSDLEKFKDIHISDRGRRENVMTELQEARDDLAGVDAAIGSPQFSCDHSISRGEACSETSEVEQQDDYVSSVTNEDELSYDDTYHLHHDAGDGSGMDDSDEASASAFDVKAAQSLQTVINLDIDQPGTLEADFIAFPSYLRSHGNRRTGLKSRVQRKQTPMEQKFPSASALADALEQDPYGGFDILDFERPSIRKRGKDRRQMPVFDGRDSDLELKLVAAWENDLVKKRAKKREREERRAAGLLGKKAGVAAARAKNANGLDAYDLKTEIREFLLSSSESLSLPIMDKRHRQVVHEIANAVTLKSQSRGGGSSRFPVLYKTGRTLDFDSANIHLVDDVFSPHRARRLGGSIRHSRGQKNHGGPRGNGRNLAVSYLDGDVVGGAAPELGADNKGRAMLEKMGWTDGTALGATNNKGILHPVSHVVRNTRAGLG